MARGPLHLGGAITRLLLAALPLAAPGAAEAQRRTATVAGVVRDSLGTSIAGVDVAVSGSGLHSRTDESGVYRIVGLLPGPATLTARRLGFAPFAQRLMLDGGEDRTVDIRLAVLAEMLSAVQVTAPHEVYDARLAGFNARSKQQVGHFVTRERIDRANSTVLSDMLREIPGVLMAPARGGGRSIRLRGANCAPLVFFDGTPASAGEFDIDMIDLKGVEGIEVYSGSATVPPEFLSARSLDRCGVIAIWSRPARPRARWVEHREPADTAVVVDTASLFTRDRVDETARLDSGSMVPSYPDTLYRLGVSGKVVVEFVVDTTGAVEPKSIDVLASSDPLFTLAVREALERARFEPARAGGRRVRQMVQMPFAFAPGGPSGPDRRL